jgi:hypothetical protein
MSQTSNAPEKQLITYPSKEQLPKQSMILLLTNFESLFHWFITDYKYLIVKMIDKIS